MPTPLASANLGKTLNYVVDIKGNRWSENIAAEVETVEELEQIASAQRKLMREAANVATNMQVNYIQVQTLLASKLAENRDSKAPFDLLDLQTDVERSSALRDDSEEPTDDEGKGAGKPSASAGVRMVDLKESDVGKPVAGKPRGEEKGGKPADAKGKGPGKTSDEGEGYGKPELPALPQTRVPAETVSLKRRIQGTLWVSARQTVEYSWKICALLRNLREPLFARRANSESLGQERSFNHV